MDKKKSYKISEFSKFGNYVHIKIIIFEFFLGIYYDFLLEKNIKIDQNIYFKKKNVWVFCVRV